MLFKLIQSDKNISDTEFNKIYPHWIRELALTHFSPLEVSKVAVGWLSEPGISKFWTSVQEQVSFVPSGLLFPPPYFMGSNKGLNFVPLEKKFASVLEFLMWT